MILSRSQVIVAHHRCSLLPPADTVSSARANKDLPRFTEVAHPYLPARVEAWADGLKLVDFRQPAPIDPHRWGHYLPTAEFVVTPTEPERLQVYVANWLHARQPIFTRLSRLSAFAPPSHKTWAIFIGRFPPQDDDEHRAAKQRAVAVGKPKGDKVQSAAQKDKRYRKRDEALEYFSRLLDQTVTARSPIIPTYTWRRGDDVSILTFDLANKDVQARFPVQVMQDLAWELSEVAFRVELFELDRRKSPDLPNRTDHTRGARVAQVFPVEAFVTENTRPTPGDGLGAPRLRDRARCLEALRQVMLRWPGHPPIFDTFIPLTEHSPEADLQAFEERAAAYYCQVFYETFGRAPVVPRVHPA